MHTEFSFSYQFKDQTDRTFKMAICGPGDSLSYPLTCFPHLFPFFPHLFHANNSGKGTLGLLVDKTGSCEVANKAH